MPHGLLQFLVNPGVGIHRILRVYPRGVSILTVVVLQPGPPEGIARGRRQIYAGGRVRKKTGPLLLMLYFFVTRLEIKSLELRAFLIVALLACFFRRED